MLVLAALLALDAVLHAWVVIRFGLADKANRPFSVFIAVYAVLAALVLFQVRYAVPITLVMSLVGLVGFTLTFNASERTDKSLDRVIWVNDLLIVLLAAYLLFAA
jgi:hypothetical protein